VEADGFQRQAQSTVVGRGIQTDGVADYVVEFDVFCWGGVSLLLFVYVWYG